MKKSIFSILLIIVFLLAGCGKEQNDDQVIRFAVSAEYPPFEYVVDYDLVGFDIELAKLIAEWLGKKAVFEDMKFASILAAVQSGSVDAGISTITVTQDRIRNFDFSDPYYNESMSMIFLKERPINTKEEIGGKKIACQLGTTLQIWLQANIPNIDLVTMDSNPQAIEALKASYVDGVFVDTVQAQEFVKQNPKLGYSFIAHSDTGYSLAFKKGSPLRVEVNEALQYLEKSGKLQQLRKKYFKE